MRQLALFLVRACIPCCVAVVAIVCLAIPTMAQGGAQRKLEGIALYKQRQFEPAFQALKQALAANPNDCEVIRYLALTAKALKASTAAGQYEAMLVQRGCVESSGPTPAPVQSAPSNTGKARPALGPIQNKWALIVGIGTFGDPKLKGLSFPAKDARDVAAALVDVCGFNPSNVVTLTDAEATQRKIKSGIENIAKNAGRDDLVVVYFSSHGSHQSADLAGKGYLIPYDVDIADLYATGISIDTFKSDIRERIRAERKVVVLDTCFSGQAADGSKAVTLGPPPGETQNSLAQALSSAGGFVIITSSSKDEQSWEDVEIRNGYFTHALVQTLKETKGQGTIRDLFLRIRDDVSKAVQAKKKARQTPCIYGDGDQIRLNESRRD